MKLILAVLRYPSKVIDNNCAELREDQSSQRLKDEARPPTHIRITVEHDTKEDYTLLFIRQDNSTWLKEKKIVGGCSSSSSSSSKVEEYKVKKVSYLPSFLSGLSKLALLVSISMTTVLEEDWCKVYRMYIVGWSHVQNTFLSLNCGNLITKIWSTE